jgi:hypothetical protein
MAGERQHVNHLALPVDTLEEFDAAYQRLKDRRVAESPGRAAADEQHLDAPQARYPWARL